jgi:hypothetical protein
VAVVAVAVVVAVVVVIVVVIIVVIIIVPRARCGLVGSSWEARRRRRRGLARRGTTQSSKA